MLLRELKVWGWVLQKNTCHEIHDPFFTTKEQVTGTCLGLDIVRKLVVKDDEKINVSSKEGKRGDVLADLSRKSVGKYLLVGLS